MPEKKSTVRQVTDAVKDAASSVAHAAQGHVVEPVGQALGLADGEKKDDKPGGGKNSAAVRMLTRSVSGKKPASGKGKPQRAADAAKPSQKPAAGAGRKGPRRGASKGR
jgi:hypothetical protein